MQWFYYLRQVFVRCDIVVLRNFELFFSWTMYPINHNLNDAVDTWYPSCAGLMIFHDDFHTFVAYIFFIFGTKPLLQPENTEAADHNFILADNTPVLKQQVITAHNTANCHVLVHTDCL